MAHIVWLPEATADMVRMYEFLYEKDADAAMKAAHIIWQASELLKPNIRLGRPMPDQSGMRELFMAFGAGAYVLRYKIDGNDNVVIVRVWHSREHR